MKSQRLRTRATRSQRGFALIAILALVALITAFLISSAINRSNADISNEREQRSMDALRQAKTALIAYAAAVDYRLQGSGATYLQPGALPCPDMDGDGKSDCIGSTTASMIGRLPWQTLGINDLRDASGEQIWYALSHDFRKQQCTSPPDSAPSPTGCTKINSDTQGQLSVTGALSASNVVAVLIAPGIAMQGQVRPSNTASSYVESYSAGDGVHFSFTTNSIPDQNINDRVLVITQSELMAAVEPVVAARIEKDIAPLVQGYFNLWKAYPFPAPFAGGAPPSNPGRAQAEYKGITTQGGVPPLPEVSGLLPITTAAGYLAWTTSSITITQIPGGTGSGTNGPSNPSTCTWPGGPGGGTGCTITGVDCSSSTSSQINCRIDYDLTNNENDRPAIILSAVLQNAALSFPKPLTGLDPTMTDKNGNPVQLDPSGVTGAWSWSDVPTSTPTFFTPTVAFSAQSDGSALITFQGRLQNQADPTTGTGGRVRIRISVPSSYDVITSVDRVANPDTAWFIANEWFRQTYYAVSAGYLPGGGNSCTNLPSPPPPALSATPPFYCLKVNNLRPSYASSNDKHAILMLAGRGLTANTRPTASVTDYFENANGTSPFVYENRVGLPTSINDRIVVVSP